MEDVTLAHIVQWQMNWSFSQTTDDADDNDDPVEINKHQMWHFTCLSLFYVVLHWICLAFWLFAKLNQLCEDIFDLVVVTFLFFVFVVVIILYILQTNC